jgi:hypothetical protein
VSRAALICRFQRSQGRTVNDAGTLTVVVLPARGPLLSSLMSVSDLDNLVPATYGDLLREAIIGLREPRDIPQRLGLPVTNNSSDH